MCESFDPNMLQYATYQLIADLSSIETKCELKNQPCDDIHSLIAEIEKFVKEISNKKGSKEKVNEFIDNTEPKMREIFSNDSIISQFKDEAKFFLERAPILESWIKGYDLNVRPFIEYLKLCMKWIESNQDIDMFRMHSELMFNFGCAYQSFMTAPAENPFKLKSHAMNFREILELFTKSYESQKSIDQMKNELCNWLHDENNSKSCIHPENAKEK